MDDAELKKRFDDIEKKLDATFRAAEKSRKYLMWTGIVTIALFVLPLIGLMFAVPQFINTYSQIGGLP
jgi:hypothetical protein